MTRPCRAALGVANQRLNGPGDASARMTIDEHRVVLEAGLGDARAGGAPRNLNRTPSTMPILPCPWPALG